MVLKQWIPNFQPTKDIIVKAPVWIRLPGLPMEYWDRDIVLSIAFIAGRVPRIDENCISFERGIYARVCVEVALSKPLSSGTNMGVDEEETSFFLTIVYEKLPNICFGCGHVGH